MADPGAFGLFSGTGIHEVPRLPRLWERNPRSTTPATPLGPESTNHHACAQKTEALPWRTDGQTRPARRTFVVWETSDGNLSSSRSHTACADDLSHSGSTKFLELNNVLCHCTQKQRKNEESHEIQTKRVQTRLKVFSSKTSWLALIKHVQMK